MYVKDMYKTQFEPFGEPLAQATEVPKARKGSLQDAIVNVTVGVFWSLVIGIVAARAMYFSPNIADYFVACIRSAFAQS
jgi:hypothetical protein